VGYRIPYDALLAIAHASARSLGRVTCKACQASSNVRRATSRDGMALSARGRGQCLLARGQVETKDIDEAIGTASKSLGKVGDDGAFGNAQWGGGREEGHCSGTRTRGCRPDFGAPAATVRRIRRHTSVHRTGGPCCCSVSPSADGSSWPEPRRDAEHDGLLLAPVPVLVQEARDSVVLRACSTGLGSEADQ